MIPTEGQERRGDKKSSLLERLHNPTELRIFLLMLVLGIGYGAIYLPLDKTIAGTTKKLAEAQKRLKLAEEVENLHTQYSQIASRIPKNPDASEWMQFVLNGLRQSPLKLEAFNPDAPKAMGAYQVLGIKIRVSGSFADLDAFLHWLESNPRLFRVDNVRLTAGDVRGEDDAIRMELSILGVMG
jgi:Tfp pilus assembly protein PilO